MQTKILSGIPFSVTLEKAASWLHLTEDLLEEFEPIYNRCVEIAVPKMVYGVASVELLEDNRVQVGEVEFKSKILHTNLNGVKTAYPYVCTSGREVYEYALSLSSDPLEQYWADSVSESILHSAITNATERLQIEYSTGKLYAMTPGSLPDWPMPQQRPLFQLLGDVMGDIGVELNSSCLMLPVKSVSGLLFESEKHYSNCSLCPREGCVGRRAPYDPSLSEEYGVAT